MPRTALSTRALAPLALTLTAFLAACASQERPDAAPRATTPAFNPPATEQTVVTDVYHGTRVLDAYRWLENPEDPKVSAWSDAQNAAARAYLDNLPNVDALRARITALETGASSSYTALHEAGGSLFALKNQPPKQQAMLVAMPSPDRPAEERIIVDPNAIDPTGHTAIDWFKPSADGRLVAVSMSAGGSESGDVHIFDTVSASRAFEVIPRVNGGTAGGTLAWLPDASGFYYTRYPRAGERPAEDLDFYVHVYFHNLGTPTEQDRYETGKDFPRIAEIVLETSKDGRFVLAGVQNGDGGEYLHSLRTPDGAWTQFTRYADRVVHAVLGDDAVYMVSRLGAPRGKIIRLPLTDSPGISLSNARVIIPEQPRAVETDFLGEAGLWIDHGHVFVQYQDGGPNVISVFNADGTPRGDIPAPPVSSTDAFAALSNGDVLFRCQSYLAPPAWFRYDIKTAKAARTALFRTSPADFSDAEVVREWAVSKDGTRVPMTILRRKGAKLDGNNPTLLWGYGGYGVCESPTFNARHRVWLDRGGVFVCANIRGGGEFGDEWHKQGNLANKQNVFDDFVACANRLIELRYTRSERLALQGGSNGGLLMGATFTQHPRLARAVVSSVGIYDMLRVELTPNGAFNVPEFGTVKDKTLFNALLGYSPYHAVKPATPYPAVLMMTGKNDPRVDPWHSRKMTARLQASTSSGLPVLLRTDANAGHGMGSSLSQRIEMLVDVYAFLFHELGVDDRPPNENPERQRGALRLSSPSPRRYPAKTGARPTE